MNLQVTLMLKDLHVPWDPKHTKHEISKDQCFKEMHVIASYHESQIIHGWSWIEIYLFLFFKFKALMFFAKTRIVVNPSDHTNINIC